MSEPKFEDYEAQYPDHELVVYRNRMTPIEGCPNGFLCIIAVPKAKIEAALRAGQKPPFWRHGELIDVRPPGEAAEDHGAPGSLRSASGSSSSGKGAA